MTKASVASRSVRERFWWITPAGVFLLAAAVASWAIGPYLVGVFHDDGIYALLAKSIAEGDGFHYSNLPGAPAATHYPPLYPILLAILWKLYPAFPENVSFLVGFNALLVGVAAAGWWYFAKRREQWNAAAAALAALFCTLALPTFALAGALLSETLFLAMLWPVLLASERSLEDTTDRSAVIAGVSVGALMLVRTHAVALIVALAVLLVAARQVRRAGIAFGSAIAVQLPWVLFTMFGTPRVARPLEGAYGSYLGWFITGIREGGGSFMAATVRQNAHESWLYVEDRVAAAFPGVLHWLALLTLVAAMIAGGFALWRRSRVTVLFTAFYLAIVLVWPYNPWRFIWVVWPLLLLFAFSGFRFVSSRGGRWRYAGAALAILPVAAIIRVELHAYAIRDWKSASNAGAAQIIPVLRWVHANLPPTGILLSEGEQVLTLYEGRLAAPPSTFTAREYLAPPAGADGAARLSEMIRTIDAGYVILMNPAMIQSAQLLANDRPGLKPVHSMRTAVVFEVVR